jgi:membrane associated rhomboid family serine protease
MPPERRPRDDRASAFPWALAAIGAALLAGYGVELAVAEGEGGGELAAFVQAWGLVPREAIHGRVAPLVTSIFLHADAFHLLANVAFLVAFGVALEPVVGAGRFAALFVGCGLAAGAVHVATAPDSFVATIGASGAVSGVLGAWWRLRERAIAHPGALGATPSVVLLGLWLAVQIGAVAVGAAEDAGWGHLGGFAAGLAAGPWLARAPTGVRTRTG